MNKAKKQLLMMSRGAALTVAEKIIATSPTLYWSLQDATGSSVFDEPIAGADATISGATFSTGGGLGGDAWSFDGNDNASFSGGALTALQGAFSGQVGTLVVFAKMAAVANSDYRVMMQIGADANNRVYIMRYNDNSQVLLGRYGGGTAKQVLGAFPGTFTNWNLYALTWDKTTANNLKAYVSNGSSVAQFGTTQSTLPDFAGSAAAALSHIASYDASLYMHNGLLNHIIYYNTVKDLTFLSNLASIAGVI